MVHPTDLHYFLELSRTLHMSRAAERLGITQPALSHSLKRMESDLGSELFVRTKKGLVLTSAGQRFLERAQSLILQWEEVKLAVKADSDEVSGVIKLGCHSAVAQYTLPEFMPSLLKEHPRLEIRLEHGLSRHMTEQVISHRLDVAIAVNPVANPDLVIKELCRDQVSFWRNRRCVNPDILMIEPSLMQTQELLRKCARQGLSFKRVLESPSLEVLCQLTAAGTGIAILPGRVARAMSESGIETVRGTPTYEDRICLVYRPEFLKTRRGKAFVSCVRG